MSAFEIQGGSVTSEDGWIEAGETWTYASADDPTYTFTIAGVDRTGKYSAGMRIKLTQATGGVKYGIVTKVAFSTDTTVTVYMGTDYDLNNEAILSPYYSTHKAPVGFPLDPEKWTVGLTDTSDRRMSSPSAGVWQNPGSLSLSIPTGVWDVTAKYPFEGISGKDTVASLSTANNSESDATFTAFAYAAPTSGSTVLAISSTVRGTIVATAKTTYYVVQKSDTGGAGTFGLYGVDNGNIRIRAVCAYL